MMKTRTTHGRAERGFTLPELLMSVGLGSIVMMATLSFMGVTRGAWTKGNERSNLTDELTIATSTLVSAVHTAKIESVSVSGTGDTLRIGGGTRFYRTAGNDLIFKTPTKTTTLLDSMITAFRPTVPWVRSLGDTLKTAVFVTFIVNNNGTKDSTSVVLVPRAK